jgi:hypothetical protein
MQCHVEMTELMIREWCAIGADEITANSQSPAVQSPQNIESQIQAKLTELHQVATQLYRQWLHGLSH